MPKVVVYDWDDTLSSSASLGEAIRPLFEVLEMKEIFKAHREAGDYVMIISHQTDKAVIEDSLIKAQVLPLDSTIQVYGKRDKNTHDKVAFAENIQNRSNGYYEAVVIIDDAISINDSDEDTIHIMVPINPTNDGTIPSPASSFYTQAALLPVNILKKEVKPLVKTIKENYHLGQIDAAKLNHGYHRAVVTNNLIKSTIDSLDKYILNRGSEETYLGKTARLWGTASTKMGLNDNRSQETKIKAAETTKTMLKHRLHQDYPLPKPALGGALGLIVKEFQTKLERLNNQLDRAEPPTEYISRPK